MAGIATAAIIGAGISAAGGIAGGLIGGGRRRAEQRAAQGEQQRQQLIASGDARSQELEMQKTGNLLQMAAGRKQAADEARQQALSTAIGGVMGAGQILGAGAMPTGE
jgi:hypothetical protein